MTPPASHARWTISLLAIAGTLPYLGLKVLWLSGSRVGLLDPDFAHSAVMNVANTLTMLLDAVAVAMALAFVTTWGRRLPARLLLFPMWVGTGLLAPILVILPLQLVLGTPSSGAGEAAPIADWVYALVYASFAWQGLFLLIGFVLYARSRWPEVLAGRGTSSAPRLRNWLVLALLLTAGVGQVATAVRAGPVSAANLGGDLAMTAAAAAGLLLITTRRPPHVPGWLAVLLIWTGSGAVAAWGLYTGVLLVVPNDLVGDRDLDPVAVLTQVLRIAAGLATITSATWSAGSHAPASASAERAATSFQASTRRSR